MKNILLVVLLFAFSISTAQTLTVSGTTYNIVSGDLLTISNSYVRGLTYGASTARSVFCNEPMISLEPSRITPDGTTLTGRNFYYTTYVGNDNGAPTNVSWVVIDSEGTLVEDITAGATNDYGDYGEFTYEEPSHLERSIIRFTYTDRCGTYQYDYLIGSSNRVMYPNGMRPPKVRRPV